MDDLNEKIERLLSSPDGMAKIQSMMAALGGGGDSSAADTPPSPPPSPPSSASAAGLPDLGTIAKLAPLMGAFSQESDDTRLLQALRPYLHGERADRLDESVKLLRLTRLLPLLQQAGLFGGSEQNG